MSGFTGSYALKKWSKSKIAGGTTDMTELAEPPGAQFSYKVDLGNPGGGVTARTATFKTKAAAAGKITFRYRYDIFHAWFQVEASFLVFSRKGDHEQTQTFLFENWGSTGERTFEGVISIDVEKGGAFGFEIGGGNFDSTSTLNGTLTITEFEAPEAETKNEKE